MALIDYSNKVIYWDEVNWQWLPYIAYRGSKDNVVFVLQYKGTSRKLSSKEEIIEFLTQQGYFLQPISKLGITELSLGYYLYNGKVYCGEGRISVKTLSKLLSLISGKTPTNMSAQLKGLGILTKEKVRDLVSKSEFIEFRGRDYTSYSNLARRYGVSHNTLFKNLKEGKSLEEIISKYENSKIVDHLGKEYRTEKEMYESWGIPRNAYAGRKGAGWSLKDILTTPVKDRKSSNSWVDFNGKRFTSITAMCKEYGVSRSSVTLYMRKGMSPGEAIKEMLKRRDSSSEVKDHLGNTFSSVTNMLKHWGVFGSTFRYRMENGWSLEEALTSKNLYKRKSNK